MVCGPAAQVAAGAERSLMTPRRTMKRYGHEKQLKIENVIAFSAAQVAAGAERSLVRDERYGTREAIELVWLNLPSPGGGGGGAQPDDAAQSRHRLRPQPPVRPHARTHARAHTHTHT